MSYWSRPNSISISLPSYTRSSQPCPQGKLSSDSMWWRTQNLIAWSKYSKKKNLWTPIHPTSLRQYPYQRNMEENTKNSCHQENRRAYHRTCPRHVNPDISMHGLQIQFTVSKTSLYFETYSLGTDTACLGPRIEGKPGVTSIHCQPPRELQGKIKDGWVPMWKVDYVTRSAVSSKRAPTGWEQGHL